MRSGAVTARLSTSSLQTVDCQAWGDGAAEFLDLLPGLVGAQDDSTKYVPTDPVIAEARSKVVNLRLCRTGRLLESLIPAIFEQRVQGLDAWRAYRRLTMRYGAPAPGPAPSGMRLPPTAEAWRRIPSWEFHRANVDPGRARTIVGCAQRADSLEKLTEGNAHTALRSLPGIGEWSAAETMQRTFGDADALSVGDYHLATMIGWTLVGHPIDDEAMVELLEPERPHRHRAVRLLEASGLARNPRFGARQAIPNLRKL